MATFYIQLADKLLKIGSDVTQETIQNALGYVPSNFSGNFNDLIDNPFTITDNGEFNIVDENGNIAAKFDANGLHVIDVEVISEDGVHKLSKKADKSFVENLVFSSNENLPFKEDDSGSFDIVDSNNNVIATIDEYGITSTEFNADGHKLTEKIDNKTLEERLDAINSTNFSSGQYVNLSVSQAKGRVTNVKIDDTALSNTIQVNDGPDFQVADERGNVAFKINKKGVEGVEFYAGIHRLTNKVERTYVDDEILKVKVDTKKSIENINFSDLKENPFNDSEPGTLKIIDDNGNIKVTVDNEGVTSTEFIAGEHKLTEKSDLSYVNNRFSDLNSTVNGVGSVNNIRVTVNEANGKLVSAFVDDSNIDFNNLKNNPLEEDSKGYFSVVDEQYNIGFKLDESGAISKDFTTSSGASLNDVNNRVKSIENLLNEDGDNVINNINDVIEFFTDVKENERALTLISTVSTHTNNIGTLNSGIQNNKNNITTLSGSIESLRDEMAISSSGLSGILTTIISSTGLDENGLSTLENGESITSAITKLQNIKYASSSSIGGAADSVANAVTFKAGSSKEFNIASFNGSSAPTIPVPTKMSHLENDSNLRDDFDNEFHIIDNEGNKIATFNNDGLIVSKVTTIGATISEDFISNNGISLSSLNNQMSTLPFDYYKSIGGPLDETQYKLMVKYFYTPFMISTNSTTYIPEELLNEGKNNFFSDYYWNIMRLNGGEPIITIQWENNIPYRIKGVSSEKTFKISFINRTITPE